MAREGTGRIHRLGKYSLVVRIPSDVASDGLFSFREGELVKVHLREDGVVEVKKRE